MKRRLKSYQGWELERCKVGDHNEYYAWDEDGMKIQDVDLKELKGRIRETNVQKMNRYNEKMNRYSQNKDVATGVIAIFEDFLRERNVKISSSEEEKIENGDADSSEIIVGCDFVELQDLIAEYLAY